MMKRFFKVLFALTFMLGISSFAASADTVLINGVNHTDNFMNTPSTPITHYEYDLTNFNTNFLDGDPGYQKGATQTSGYFYNSYVAVKDPDPTGTMASVHYYNACYIKGVPQQLNYIWIKAGSTANSDNGTSSVYKVIFDQPLKPGECAYFNLQEVNKGIPAVSHMVTTDFNYSDLQYLQGFKLNGDAQGDVGFADKQFNFIIKELGASGETQIATATSELGTGKLKFYSSSVNGGYTLPLKANTDYKVIETDLPGYLVSSNKLMFETTQQTLPTQPSNTMTFNSGSISKITFTYYNKKDFSMLSGFKLNAENNQGFLDKTFTFTIKDALGNLVYNARNVANEVTGALEFAPASNPTVFVPGPVPLEMNKAYYITEAAVEGYAVDATKLIVGGTVVSTGTSDVIVINPTYEKTINFTYKNMYQYVQLKGYKFDAIASTQQEHDVPFDVAGKFIFDIYQGESPTPFATATNGLDGVLLFTSESLGVTSSDTLPLLRNTAYKIVEHDVIEDGVKRYAVSDTKLLIGGVEQTTAVDNTILFNSSDVAQVVFTYYNSRLEFHSTLTGFKYDADNSAPEAPKAFDPTLYTFNFQIFEGTDTTGALVWEAHNGVDGALMFNEPGSTTSVDTIPLKENTTYTIHELPTPGFAPTVIEFMQGTTAADPTVLTRDITFTTKNGSDDVISFSYFNKKLYTNLTGLKLDAITNNAFASGTEFNFKVFEGTIQIAKARSNATGIILFTPIDPSGIATGPESETLKLEVNKTYTIEEVNLPLGYGFVSAAASGGEVTQSPANGKILTIDTTNTGLQDNAIAFTYKNKKVYTNLTGLKLDAVTGNAFVSGAEFHFKVLDGTTLVANARSNAAGVIQFTPVDATGTATGPESETLKLEVNKTYTIEEVNLPLGYAFVLATASGGETTQGPADGKKLTIDTTNTTETDNAIAFTYKNKKIYTYLTGLKLDAITKAAFTDPNLVFHFTVWDDQTAVAYGRSTTPNGTILFTPIDSAGTPIGDESNSLKLEVNKLYRVTEDNMPSGYGFVSTTVTGGEVTLPGISKELTIDTNNTTEQDNAISFTYYNKKLYTNLTGLKLDALTNNPFASGTEFNFKVFEGTIQIAKARSNATGIILFTPVDPSGTATGPESATLQLEVNKTYTIEEVNLPPGYGFVSAAASGGEVTQGPANGKILTIDTTNTSQQDNAIAFTYKNKKVYTTLTGLKLDAITNSAFASGTEFNFKVWEGTTPIATAHNNAAGIIQFTPVDATGTATGPESSTLKLEVNKTYTIEEVNLPLGYAFVLATASGGEATQGPADGKKLTIDTTNTTETDNAIAFIYKNEKIYTYLTGLKLDAGTKAAFTDPNLVFHFTVWDDRTPVAYGRSTTPDGTILFTPVDSIGIPIGDESNTLKLEVNKLYRVTEDNMPSGYGFVSTTVTGGEVTQPTGASKELIIDTKNTTEQDNAITFTYYNKKLYARLTGFKVDYAKYLDGYYPLNQAFNFVIKTADGTQVATAKSDPITGKFTFTDNNNVVSTVLLLDINTTYMIEEVNIPMGYEFRMTRQVDEIGIADATFNPATITTTIDPSLEQDKTITFYCFNKHTMTWSPATAWAIWDPMNPQSQTLQSIMKNAKWGWYLKAVPGTYQVFAGAGQNSTDKGTLIGNVTVSIENNKFVAVFKATGDSYVNSMQFGVYKTLPELVKTGGAPGKLTNKYTATEIQASAGAVMAIHFDAQVVNYLP